MKDTYIHDVLISNGYKCLGHNPSTGKHHYRSCYEYKGVLFRHEIRLDFDKQDFLEIPEVYLLEQPEGIPERMPHFEAHGRICYLDKEEYFLDPFDGHVSASHLVRKIQLTFEDTVDFDEGQHAEEHAHEFSAYWQGEIVTFLGSREEYGQLILYSSEVIGTKDYRNVAVYLPNAGANKWFLQQQDRIDFDSIESPIPALLVNSKQLPLIKPSESWPPNSLKEFLTWFKSIDSSGFQTLVNQATKILTKKKLGIIVRFKNEHSVGFILEKSNRGHPWINGLLQRKAPKKNIIQALMSNKNFQSFKRIMIMDSSQEFILNRNNDVSLLNKRIALIGAGTIGGYLAHQLCQNGAGFEQGVLKVFDGDIFDSANIGRHLLGTSYLLQRKSNAIKHFIQSDYHYSATNIYAEGVFDYQQIQQLKAYDLVIDATGNRQFSTLLSYHWRNTVLSSRPTAILHVWIDAAGESVRALLDDGHKGCYNCFMSDVNESYPYKKGVEPQESIRRNCAGSSYFEFSSSPSVLASGLALQMALSYVNGQPSPRYKNLPVTENVKKARARDIEVKGTCQCQTI